MTYVNTIAKLLVRGTPPCDILSVMIRRRLIRSSKAVSLAAARGFTALAVAAKLLVPVGFMPAALASGSPIMLCDGGRGALAAVPMAASVMGRHPVSAAELVHRHESGAAPTSHGQPVPGAIAGPPHEHGEGGSGQHEWERCSLGGLATLAAVAFEISFVVADPGGDLAPQVVEQTWRTEERTTGFLARAPPIALA